MITLTIRTDKPEAEIALYKDLEQLNQELWQAHRKLAETLHGKVAEILQKHGLTLKDIDAVVCYKGPGSFTGLRIGITVGNALAYSLGVPVAAETGTDWQAKAIERLRQDKGDNMALPEYGADVHITHPKH